MTPMFAFDPAEYAATFAAHEYVRIPKGLTEEFYQQAVRQVEQSLETSLMKQFAIGDKQQAKYEFPGPEYVAEFRRMVGGVTRLDPERLVISERHIKAYEEGANAYPLAHKDRFATQVAVGFSIRVPQGSTLVLYPDTDRAVNPFSSSTEYRASLAPERLAEVTCKNARRVEIQDEPRDVMMFRGNSIWHLRERPAGTVMLYFKLNAFNCDPLGEDPETPAHRERSRRLAKSSDADLAGLVPVLGRRVDHVHRRYNHHWQETLGVVLYGEKHFTIDEQEVRALQLMNGQRPLRAILEALAPADQHAAVCQKVRRLVERGVVDLLPAPLGGSEESRARPEPALAAN